jgi:hypothetical protein
VIGGDQAHRPHGRARWRRWAGALVGALAVSVAVLAVLNEQGDRGPAGGAGGEGEIAAEEPGQSLWRHTFPAAYQGPVWITVEAPDEEVRTVRIVWGAWQRHIVHEGSEPVTYHFLKGGGPNIAVAVRVDPDATVTFDSGPEPPAGAEDVNAGWTPNETVEAPSQ